MGKPSPKYWWDFQHAEDGSGIVAVVVESDDDRFPKIREFPVSKNGGADAQIEAAERLISDLTAGRADPRRAVA